MGEVEESSPGASSWVGLRLGGTNKGTLWKGARWELGQQCGQRR